MTDPHLLLCADLDRTLLPNGPHPESPGARTLFKRFSERAQVTLVYVTGRHRTLLDRAIASYGLPQPDFAITDAGTKIHTCERGGWRPWPDWEQEIAGDWAGHDHAALRRLFRDLKPLRLQGPDTQNTHKLSYLLPVQTDRQALQQEMQRRLDERNIRAGLVWSVEEPAGVGLLDVVPARATKLHAVEFLRRHLGFTPEQTLFAGDSGSDLPLMVSAIPSVLVANAVERVKTAALKQARSAGHENALYLARGGFLGMNGNYSAGILEGAHHFHPALAAWIEQA